MNDEAVIICTRNRPDDLARLFESLSAQDGMRRRLILVVDASGPGPAERNQALAQVYGDIKVRYLRYDRLPSLARQRNFGVEILPQEIKVVHFLDDDVTLESGCLDRLSQAFEDPDVSGVGAKVVVPGGASLRKPTLVGRFFLLDSRRQSVVLISGATTPGQVRAAGPPFETRWLGGCASYRRDVLMDHRFDDRLEGYSLDEDLDLSYRVGAQKRLMIVPAAIVHHHESEKERAGLRDYTHDRLVHRYWFLEKNLRHPLRKAAFWWSTAGRLLAVRFRSDKEMSTEELAGLLAGARTVWKRTHPLLTRLPSGS